MHHQALVSLLTDEAEQLLSHVCQKIPKSSIMSPSGSHVSDVFAQSDRSPAVQENLARLYGTGRLANTGYLSIFPVDQGVEHTAAFSFYENPLFFDPENIVRMALEGECSAVASTLGALGLVSKKYADKMPFIVKLNHNELLTYPNKHDQVIFASVKQAREMGAVGVGATIYFGSPESDRQLVEVAALFAAAHEAGLLTILWCYPRNDRFAISGRDYTDAVDVTAQANHLGVTIEADIIKQKLPSALRAFHDLQFGKSNEAMYDRLLTENPIDLVRYQVAHCYMGKISMINSGGESNGDDDLAQAVRTAVINKRAGGAGLIMGRKVFKRPFNEGVQILHAVQDVYLDQEITIA
ncbi:class I fructose-bisphosphate aldolase [Candidatus Woesebacteria bacterium]|nr:class I fructose-bisphosphate aldolase [Candidatus Woesebacteria bacterium]